MKKSLSILLFIFAFYCISGQTPDVSEETKIRMFNNSLKNGSTSPSFSVFIATDFETLESKEVCIDGLWIYLPEHSDSRETREIEYIYDDNYISNYIRKYDENIVKKIDSLINKRTLKGFKKILSYKKKGYEIRGKNNDIFRKKREKFYSKNINIYHSINEIELLKSIRSSGTWDYDKLVNDSITDENLKKLYAKWIRYASKFKKIPESKYYEVFRKYEKEYRDYFAHYLFNKGILTRSACLDGHLIIDEVYED